MCLINLFTLCEQALRAEVIFLIQGHMLCGWTYIIENAHMHTHMEGYLDGGKRWKSGESGSGIWFWLWLPRLLCKWKSSLYMVMRAVWEEAWHLNSPITTLARNPKQRSKSQSAGRELDWIPICFGSIFESSCTLLLVALLLRAIKGRWWKLWILLEPYVRWSASESKKISNTFMDH